MPPVTTTSEAVNPVTGSLNVKVKVTGPLAVPDVSSVIVSVGGAVSTATTAAALLLPMLPRVSLTEAVTDTLPLP